MLLSFKRVFRKSDGADGIPVDSRDLRHNLSLVQGRGQDVPGNPAGDTKRAASAISAVEIAAPGSGVKIRTLRRGAA